MTSHVFIISSVGNSHFAIQAEHGDVVYRIVEIRRLDHVVLLVATQAMLRTERRNDLHARRT